MSWSKNSQWSKALFSPKTLEEIILSTAAMISNFKGNCTQNINVTLAESFLQTMMLGKNFMKIGPTVGKIQALKCFKITVMMRRHFDLAVMWPISKNSYTQEY